MTHSLELVILLLLIFLKQSISMTRYGQPCFGECKKSEGYDYYSCYILEVYKSNIRLQKSGFTSKLQTLNNNLKLNKMGDIKMKSNYDVDFVL